MTVSFLSFAIFGDTTALSPITGELEMAGS